MVFHTICISLSQVYSENIIRDASAEADIYRGFEIHDDAMPHRDYFEANIRDWLGTRIRGDRDNNNENAGLDFFASPRDSPFPSSEYDRVH